MMLRHCLGMIAVQRSPQKSHLVRSACDSLGLVVLVCALVGVGSYLGSSQRFLAKLKSETAAKSETTEATSIYLPANANSWNFHAGLGLGLFQDIQVPADGFSDRRGDGKLTALENQDHQGIPVIAGLEWRRPFQLESDYRGYTALGFEALQMFSSAGPEETQSSSYHRLGIHSDLIFQFGTDRSQNLRKKYRRQLRRDGEIPTQTKMGSYVGLSSGARRTTFRNVSNGHYIQAATLGLKGGWSWWKSYSLEAEYAIAPWAQFAYVDGSGFGGQKLKTSRTTLSEAKFTGSLFLSQTTWLDLGIEKEMAQVQIDDVSEYAGFGLGISPELRESRLYQLETSIWKLGIRKSF